MRKPIEWPPELEEQFRASERAYRARLVREAIILIGILLILGGFLYWLVSDPGVGDCDWETVGRYDEIAVCR